MPVNPASLINVQPLEDRLLDGALPAVYKHKTQDKDKSLVIMYANLYEQDIIISPNQLIGYGSMLYEAKSTLETSDVAGPVPLGRDRSG